VIPENLAIKPLYKDVHELLNKDYQFVAIITKNIPSAATYVVTPTLDHLCNPQVSIGKSSWSSPQ